MNDGYYYNPIQCDNATPQDKNFAMPIWVASPPTQRQRQKRTRTILSLDDSDNDSDNKNENHHNDEEMNVTRKRQKTLKMEQKTEALQYRKRKEITTEEPNNAQDETGGHRFITLLSAHTTRRKCRHQRPVVLAIDQTGCHS